MFQRYGSFHRDVKEFSKDVYTVARNFLGEQDWKWAKNNSAVANNKSRFEQFIDEMTTGTKRIDNDSKMEERIQLGIGAALFTLPYALGRMVSDAALNVTQYAKWRLTHKTVDEDRRPTSGYVLGGPLSIIFIAPMSVFELALRAAGVSAYGAHLIKAAGKRATHFPKRYTWWLVPPSKEIAIKAEEEKIFSLPKNGWDVADRFGWVTLAGLIAATEIAGATLLTASYGIFETTLRGLGFTPYGATVIRAAARRAAAMSCYTRGMLGYPNLVKLERDQTTLFSKPKNGWNGWSILDRLALVTFPGIVAAVTMSIGASITVIGYTSRVLGHLLGFTEFGDDVIQLAAMRAMNLSKYTRALFRIENAAAYNRQIQRKQQDFFIHRKGMAPIDPIALVTLPGIIAATEMVMASAMTAICGTIEILGRVLGFTSYGAAIIREATKQSIRISHRYTRWLPFLKNIPEADRTILSSSPKNVLEGFNRLALFTLPGVIALAEVSIASAIAVGFGAIETCARMLGISTRSGNAIKVVFVDCATTLGFNKPKPDASIIKITATVTSWWNAVDCVGTAVSSIAASLLSTTLILPLAIIGLSKSNYHRFHYYRHRINNAMRERDRKPVNTTAEMYHAAQLKQSQHTIAGNFFSHANVLNVLGQGSYYIGRYFLMPFTYIILKSTTQLFGFIPLIKAIHRTLHPLHYNLSLDEDRVRQRFAELTNAIDRFGKLPLGEGNNEELEAIILKVEKRNLFTRARFSLFTEVRKAISFGSSPDEKVLSVFKDRFEEFIRAKRRQRKQGLNINQFFSSNPELDRGERFSYVQMRERAKRSFSRTEDRNEIDRVAALIKSDIEIEMRNERPRIKK